MKPILVLNPATDEAFASAAHSTLDRVTPDPDNLQAVLREHYPQAAVRARQLSGELLTVWYVYRDGHWVAPSAASAGATDRDAIGGRRPAREAALLRRGRHGRSGSNGGRKAALQHGRAALGRAFR